MRKFLTVIGARFSYSSILTVPIEVCMTTTGLGPSSRRAPRAAPGLPSTAGNASRRTSSFSGHKTKPGAGQLFHAHAARGLDDHVGHGDVVVAPARGGL